MTYCCSNCFTDVAIQELIYREATVKSCSFCGSNKVPCTSPESLTGLFELLLNCIQEDDTGSSLSTIYTNDLKILSNTVLYPNDLIRSIMGENYHNKNFKLLESITEYRTAWENFKENLIKENRFFPSNSLFSKIFTANITNDGIISKEASIFLRTVDALSQIRNKNFIFYRARISNSVLNASEMGPPPYDLASAGRANPVGIPYLYIAEDYTTCLKEVRPSNGATIYLSEITPNQELKLVDLTNPKLEIALLKFDEEEIELVLKCLNLLQQFSEELSKPILPEKSNLEYIPTQFICEYLRTLKSYDGLVFNSSYGNGRNVVLFSDKNVIINEPSILKVTSVDVQVERG
tara:strand:+ start:2240 stop:3286 length:1047 start_codon:yes stop_codon:yes gene_type:complete